MPDLGDTGREPGQDERESHNPPEDDQARKRQGPKRDGDTEDERVDREAAETFPASDPPANY
jgi:hypothetical protein